MNAVIQIINQNSLIVTLSSLGISCFVFLVLLIVLIKLNKLSKNYNKLVRGMNNKNLDEILHAHIDRVEDVVNKVKQIDNSCNLINKKAENCIQRVGIVRFNAFTDMGSDLSFAVALLDGYGDGMVISSIFGRQDQRTYLKPVIKGKSAHNLSKEETQAIQEALSKN